MPRGGNNRLPADVKRRYFEVIRSGLSGSAASQRVGVSLSRGSVWFIDAGRVDLIDTPVSPRFLTPTFIDVGSAEVFHDEDVAYASRIWADGGSCELHVRPGGYHGFDLSAPGTALVGAMIAPATPGSAAPWPCDPAESG
jgi:acetyl esterase/lipase